MDTKQLYFFIGTTAELIKLAPVVKELNRRKKFYKIITSGQNTVRFGELKGYIGNVSVYYAFKQRPIGVRLPLVIGFIIWSLKAILNYFLFFRHELRGRSKNDTFFVVHGDTVSSLLGALIAKIFKVKLVHIESGLRSFIFFEPFPEEICRYIVSRFADIHFCPNDWCVGNLKSVKGEKINTGENTLIETFTNAIQSRSNSAFLRAIKKRNRKYCVFAIHRQEHVLINKAKTEEIVTFLLRHIPPAMLCVFVVHDLSAPFIGALKAKTDEKMFKSVIFTSIMPYGDYMSLLKDAEFMVTDGGSNQEEMYYMGKPCLLVRKYTERIEGLGENILLSKNEETVIGEFLHNYPTYERSPVNVGKRPSEIIVNRLTRYER